MVVPASARRTGIPRWLRRATGPLLLLLLWQLLVMTGVLAADVLASPGRTAQVGWDLISDGSLPSAMAASLRRVAFGLLLGTVTGTGLALHAVIDDLRLDIARGEFVALLGRSGCGTSTLLRILAGLDRDIEGTALVPRRRAVAFQAPRLMPWKKVWRNILLGLPGRPERAVAERALDEVGPGDRVHAWPKTLSGGEAQRVYLARALVRESDLLLLDEPFGALDALTRIKAQRLVGQLGQRRGCTVLLVTQDVEEAVLLADRVLVMDCGRIADEQHVGLDRPREISDPRSATLRARLLGLLGVDTAVKTT
ncbi:ATP-binding cassette domain-containing protein [Streptomyces sp. NPDC018347]|uniref:ABC transporter ATP-binding protein n=1 Tax=Streptomyces sp. NPDC018347 TaxID=3157193 RepID=UPI0033C71DFA